MRSLAQRRDGSWDVITDKGAVHAEHVVNCAGLWAREVGHMVGIELPVLAMEHHYLLPRIFPSWPVASTRSSTTDYAGEIYMRQERGGALIGTYEPQGVIWSALKTPDDSRCSCWRMISSAWRHTSRSGSSISRRSAARASARRSTARLPSLPTAIRWSVRCAACSNYWVACAVMAGFSQGGGIGLVLSRWMARQRSRPGHPVDGRGALRRIRHAPIHVAQGAGELLAPLPAGLPERGVGGRPTGAPFTDLRSAAGSRRA